MYVERAYAQLQYLIFIKKRANISVYLNRTFDPFCKYFTIQLQTLIRWWRIKNVKYKHNIYNLWGSQNSGDKRHLRMYPVCACSLWRGSKFVIVCNKHTILGQTSKVGSHGNIVLIFLWRHNLSSSQQAPHITCPMIICCNYQAPIPHYR